MRDTPERRDPHREDSPADASRIDMDAILRETREQNVDGTATRPLLPVVHAALRKRGHPFAGNPEGTRVSFSITGEHATYQCVFLIDDDMRWLGFFVRPPFLAPEEKRPAIAEALTRANYGLPIGNFEMDFADGEVRYKASIDVEGGQLAPLMVTNLIDASLTTCEIYYPALLRVINDDVSPEAAIREVEM